MTEYSDGVKRRLDPVSVMPTYGGMSTISYYSQTEAAKLLEWTKQYMHWRIGEGRISTVRTLGEHAHTLIPGSEVARILKSEGKKARK